ncbi:glycosyltransferase family A protein [Dokdonella sp.]|uniref:glycosyltransferase family 2 protein n=1 Tax=Dokdonella sp. TaxID=2291710 RepID=UPI002F423BBC
MPVRNEARFIDASLTALRAQDHPHVEIIVCDNASDDDTLAICERHALADARVRIERSSQNLGAIGNFRRAFELARGEYFMWASGHDLWSTDFVSACASRLQAESGASIAFAGSRWIDAEGGPLARASGWADTRGLAPLARWMTVFWGNMHPIYGLIRSAHLRACAAMEERVGADLVLLAELALRGDFVHVPGPLWSRREFRRETAYEHKLARYSSHENRIAGTVWRRRFPLLGLPLALAATLSRANIRGVERWAALLALAGALPLRHRIGRRMTIG